MIDISFYVKTTPDGSIERVYVHSQGVDYFPVTVSMVNGEYRFVFRVNGEIDTTPAIAVNVQDGINMKERVG